MSDTFTIPERFRSELREALLAHPAVGAPPQQAREGRPPLAIRAGAAVTLAAAIVVAVILALGSGGELAPRPATAASVLRASADTLERAAPSLALGRGRYFYSRMAVWWRYVHVGPRPYVVRSIDEQWVARDGAGRDRVRVVSVTGLGPHPHAPVAPAGDQRLAIKRRPFLLSPLPAPAGLSLSYAQLRALPGAPARLDATIGRIRALHPLGREFSSRRWQIFQTFAILRDLADTPAPPRVRAALYRALAATPGIRLLGRRTDSAGRTGMAVAVRSGALELMLIIDPATGQLLQTSRALLRRSSLWPGWPAGLVNRTTFLAAGVVGSTHARPR